LGPVRSGSVDIEGAGGPKQLWGGAAWRGTEHLHQAFDAL
jgi:hypothetical protein